MEPLTRAETALALTSLGFSDLSTWVLSLYSRRDLEGYLRNAEAGYFLATVFNPQPLSEMPPMPVFSLNGSMDLKDYSSYARSAYGMVEDAESVIEMASTLAMPLPLYVGMSRLLKSVDGLTFLDSLKPCSKDTFRKVFSRELV